MAELAPLDKKIIYIAGLPRAGSTLLCQLLGLHDEIYSVRHSSPLAQMVTRIRADVSDDPFFLSQLDVDFDLTYDRLLNAYRGLINGWFAETNLPVVVDKNRAWLRNIETLDTLDPDFQMIVCLRDPCQVFGSIEAQHRKTRLIDFADHMAAASPYQRADALFAEDGVVGGPLKSIEHLQDLPESFRERVAYVDFDTLVTNPGETMDTLFDWLKMDRHAFDPDALPVEPHESDSYYRFKFRHATHDRVQPPAAHQISPKVESEISKNFAWFYELFYPDEASTAN